MTGHLKWFLALAICIFLSTMARSEGLNSENFYPAIDNRSGVLWETPRTVTHRAFLFGYTFSYALRPVEFGDGKSERIKVSDHLQVNHLAMAYAPLSWLDLGVNLPVALYSAPSAVDGYLQRMTTRERNFFFIGDLRLRAKASLPFLSNQVFQSGVLLSANFPTGAKDAMLTDDSTRIAVELPMSFSSPDERYEVFLTPGAAYWENGDRVYATKEGTSQRDVILAKSRSLLIALGARFWFAGKPSEIGAGTLFFDGGIRGDFDEFSPTLNGRASPVEWSGGAGFFLSKSLSVHGGYGTGVGSGATAPLSRLVAGIRYLAEPPPAIVEEEKYDTLLSTSAYNDTELTEIMRQAQGEPTPPRLGEDESILRLKSAGQVIDLGKIRFEFNSAKLTQQAKDTVLLLHQELQRLHPQSVRIDGHTDSVGSFKYNLALSKKRAESVKAELVRLGNDGSIISTEGFAYKYPIASNGSRDGRAQNRRIEVALDGDSFRKPTYTPEELQQFEDWIAPGGQKPTSNK